MRRTRHRRRYHTDRIVQNRRKRYLRETPPQYRPDANWLAGRLSYGRLATMDPWDCGRPACGICHTPDPGKRAREKRAWRLDQDA